MRRMINLLQAGIFLPLFTACQIGGMEPSVTTLMLPYEAKIANCAPYTYVNKEGGKTTLGQANGTIILVRFNPEVTLRDRQQLLAQYPFYDRMDGEVAMDSGEITKVLLRPEATCFEAEKTMKMLQKHDEVAFATPVFDPLPAQAGTYEWVGLTNEFLVSLEGQGTRAQLEVVAQQTNTKILLSLSDDLHVLSADKNSSGNALELSNRLNKLSFIARAEPNYIYYLTPTGVEDTGQRLIQSKSARIKN